MQWWKVIVYDSKEKDRDFEKLEDSWRQKKRSETLIQGILK